MENKINIEKAVEYILYQHWKELPMDADDFDVWLKANELIEATKEEKAVESSVIRGVVEKTIMGYDFADGDISNSFKNDAESLISQLEKLFESQMGDGSPFDPERFGFEDGIDDGVWAKGRLMLEFYADDSKYEISDSIGPTFWGTIKTNHEARVIFRALGIIE